MPTENEVFDAVPQSGAIDQPLLRNFLITRVPYAFGEDENPADFVALDSETGAIPQAVIFRGNVFQLDPDDVASAGDAFPMLATIRTSDGYVYKADGIDCCIRSVRSRSIDDQPDSGVEVGDAYIIPDAATGDDWAGFPEYIAYRSGRGWVRRAPKVGDWIYVDDEERFVRYDLLSGWTAGSGGRTFDAESIPWSAAINFGGVVNVATQTLEDPPGSRSTGATPTMPLGGTAANINDNDDTTTATTSAIGDKTGASVANRVFGQLDLGSVKDLIGIRVRDVLVSTGSSSASAMGVYYSTDGTTWTQLGAGFTLTAAALDVVRSGTFSARYVAVVTEAKNWSTATHTLSSLNAYTDVVDCDVGDAWIVGDNPIGILAGQTDKVAICEATDELTFYSAPEGTIAYDVASHALFRLDETGTWIPSSGAMSLAITKFAATGTWTKPARLLFIELWVIGSGARAGVSGGTSSFGAHASATGGASAGTPGAGTGGDDNITGIAGVGTQVQHNIMGYGGFGLYGSSDATTGAGGAAYKIIQADDLGSSESVTVGTGGAPVGGLVFIKEWTEA